MRVVVAPDKFAGTLSAAQAATAIVTGWRRHAPGDELIARPVADGGPGFLDALAASLGGRSVRSTVRGPYGEPVAAEVLVVGDTAYVESAQAAGLALGDRRDPGVASTYGVGELVLAAAREGVAEIVVGLGGSGTNDAGAGLHAALGATATGPDGTDGTGLLAGGGLGLRAIASVDLGPARAAVAGIRLRAATDVDNPLLGLRGATNGFGPQKGADPELVMALEGSLEAYAAAVGRRPDGKDPAVALGAGAAGGLGYGLLALGGERVPGVERVLEAVGLDADVAAADLVLTGEGAFDWQSLRGKVPAGVAATAARHGRPCVVLAGRVEVDQREYAPAGISAAYAVVDELARRGRPPAEAFSDAAGALAMVAERAARTWGG